MAQDYTLELSEYEAGNLKSAIEACWFSSPAILHNPLFVLNDGDWLGQIYHKLPKEKLHANNSPEGRATAAYKYPNPHLSLSELLSASLRRLPHFKNRKGEPAHTKPDGSDWSPAQWFQALLGELGEYANYRKKYERGDITLQEFKTEGAKELADAVCYLVLLAYHTDIKLDQAIKSKFNEVSDRVGSSVKL